MKELLRTFREHFRLIDFIGKHATLVIIMCSISGIFLIFLAVVLASHSPTALAWLQIPVTAMKIKDVLAIAIIMAIITK